MEQCIKISSEKIFNNSPYIFQEKAINELTNGKDIYVTAPAKSGKTSIPLIFQNLQKEIYATYKPDKVIYISPEVSCSYALYLKIKELFSIKSINFTCAFVNQNYIEGTIKTADFIFTSLDFLYQNYNLANKHYYYSNQILGLLTGSLIIVDNIHLINNMYLLAFLIIFRKQMQGLTQFMFLSEAHLDNLLELLSLSGKLIHIKPDFQDWERFPITNTVKRLKKFPQELLNLDFIMKNHHGNSLVVFNSPSEAQSVYKKLNQIRYKPKHLILLTKLMKFKDIKQQFIKLMTLKSKGYLTKDLLLITDNSIPFSLDISFESVFIELTSYNKLFRAFNLSSRGSISIYIFEPDLKKIKNTIFDKTQLKQLKFLSKTIENEYKNFSLLNEWVILRKIYYKNFSSLNQEIIDIIEEKISYIQYNNLWDKYNHLKIIKKEFCVLPSIKNIDHNLKKGNFWYLNKIHLLFLLKNTKIQFIAYFYDNTKQSYNTIQIKHLEDLETTFNIEFLLPKYPQNLKYSQTLGLNLKHKHKNDSIDNSQSVQCFLEQYTNLFEQDNQSEEIENSKGCIYNNLFQYHKHAFWCIRKQYGSIDLESILIHISNIIILTHQNSLFKIRFEKFKNYIKEYIVQKQKIPHYSKQNNLKWTGEMLSNMFIIYIFITQTQSIQENNDEIEIWNICILIGILISEHKKLFQQKVKYNEELEDEIIKIVEQFDKDDLIKKFDLFYYKIIKISSSHKINKFFPLIWFTSSFVSFL